MAQLNLIEAEATTGRSVPHHSRGTARARADRDCAHIWTASKAFFMYVCLAVCLCLVAWPGHIVQVEAKSVAVCFENCNQCGELYGHELFDIPKCGNLCVRTLGYAVPRCSDVHTLFPYWLKKKSVGVTHRELLLDEPSL